MQIKIDEDLPPQAAILLREHGLSADTVVDEGMGGWKDQDIFQRINSEERFLITSDKGFADIRYYPPGTHAGILLLRPDQDEIRPILDLLKMTWRKST